MSVAEPTPRWLRGVTNTLAIGVLVALTLAFFAPLLRGRTFSTVAGHQMVVYPWRAFDLPWPDYPQSDQADLSYPWQAFINRSLRSFSLPFWNPGSFAGQPFLANGSSAVLYPPRLLVSLLLPLGWAHDALSILHVLMAAVGMWLLLREFGLGALASLLGSVAWMFCPFNAAWLHLEVVAPVAAWLPLSLWLTYRAVARESWRASAAAVAALACALVSGHLLFMGLVYGVCLAFAGMLSLAAIGRTRGQARLGHVLRLALLTVGPMIVAAVVLLPTGLFLHSLGREPLSYEAAHKGIRVPYRVFVRLLRPPLVPPVTERQMHEMAYVGRLVAALAVVGFFSRRRGAWLGRALAVGTFLVATDTLLLQALYRVLPQVSFFSPLGRLLNLFDFGVVLLGAFGLDALLRRASRGRIGGVFGLPSAATIVACGLLVATSVELVGFARKVNPPFPPRKPRYSYPRTPLIRALVRELATGHNGPGRMLPLRGSQTNGWMPPVLYGAEPMVFGFENAGGYDSTVPDRSETVWRIVAGERVEAVLAARHRRWYPASFELGSTRLDLLPRVGVTTLVMTPEAGDEPGWPQRQSELPGLQQVYAGVDGRIYRIAAPVGPQVAAGMEIADSGEAALRRLLSPSFDHRTDAIFERQDLPERLRYHAAQGASGSARVLAKGVNTEELAVHAEGNAWLVVPTGWDAGWRAWVNGREVPVVRANYMFQGVPVTAGESRVRLVYRPPGFGLGLAVSLLGLLGLSLLFVANPARSRRSAVPASRAPIEV